MLSRSPFRRLAPFAWLARVLPRFHVSHASPERFCHSPLQRSSVRRERSEAPRRSGAGPLWGPRERRRGGVRGALAPRKNLERETGIEPATNSLEGCDSTTELLPPSCRPLRLPALRRAGPRSFTAPRRPSGPRHIRSAGLPPEARLRAQRAGGRRVVAREGLEPSKAQGRQIYSLLRLTASLPRQCVLLDESACPAGFAFAPSVQTLRREESWRRDLNPRPADYKSAALPD
jgi:hypothetical protein